LNGLFGVLPLKKPKEFQWHEGLAILLGYIGIQFGSEIISGWGLYFYVPEEGGRRVAYVAVGLVFIMFTFGRLFDAITDPLIGAWSDMTNTKPGRWRIVPIPGRRRPFIFWGALLMTGTSIAFWFPPVEGTATANLIFGTCIVALHWGFFTICQIPLDSLTPELSRSQEGRIRMGQWRAAGLIIGITLVSIAPGILIEQLDPAPAIEAPLTTETNQDDQPASAAGYRRMAVVMAIVGLLLFQPAVWFIRERYHTEDHPKKAPVREELRDAIRNRPFIIWLCALMALNLGYLAVQKIIPIWTIVGLGGTEATVSVLMLPFIVVALFAALVLTPLLSRFMRVKHLFMTSITLMAVGLPWIMLIGYADAPTETKVFWGQILFGFIGLGQGMQYALLTPVIGECIDLDESITGERREAVYNGLFGIAWKGSQALAVGIASLSMAHLGRSAAEPLGIYIVGPIASVLGLLALLVMLKYPVLDVTPETTTDFLAEQAETETSRDAGVNQVQ